MNHVVPADLVVVVPDPGVQQDAGGLQTASGHDHVIGPRGEMPSRVRLSLNSIDDTGFGVLHQVGHVRVVDDPDIRV